jgi:hypothetical protein
MTESIPLIDVSPSSCPICLHPLKRHDGHGCNHEDRSEEDGRCSCSATPTSLESYGFSIPTVDDVGSAEAHEIVAHTR